MVIIFALLGLACSIRVEQFKNIKLRGVEREVNIADKYVQTDIKFTIFNNGITPLTKFYHAVPKEFAGTLYHVQLKDRDNVVEGNIVQDLEAESRYNITVVEFVLNQPIDEGTRRQLSVQEYHYGRFSLLPKKISLTDDQLVVFQDLQHFQSFYFAESSQTRYKVNQLISYQPTKDVIERGNVLEFPQQDDLEPFTPGRVRIHMQNNAPLVQFKKVKKTIEVSHWGNIAIYENYELHNVGANLTGEFGRVTFNKYNPNAGKNALKELTAHLPHNTWGVHYRDEIGNISTSHASRSHHDGHKIVLVSLQPRFPILGGWRSNFEISYNLPTTNNLKVSEKDNSIHVLSQLFGFSVINMVAEEYEIKIILPEGASNIQFDLPVKFDNFNQTLTHSYLDTTGRPTLTFTKRLVSQFDNKNFKIQYDFDALQIFREPLMVFFACLVFFMSFVAVGRLELVTFKLKKQ